jgi:hypothetical protein
LSERCCSFRACASDVPICVPDIPSAATRTSAVGSKSSPFSIRLPARGPSRDGHVAPATSAAVRHVSAQSDPCAPKPPSDFISSQVPRTRRTPAALRLLASATCGTQ